MLTDSSLGRKSMQTRDLRGKTVCDHDRFRIPSGSFQADCAMQSDRFMLPDEALVPHETVIEAGSAERVLEPEAIGF